MAGFFVIEITLSWGGQLGSAFNHLTRLSATQNGIFVCEGIE